MCVLISPMNSFFLLYIPILVVLYVGRVALTSGAVFAAGTRLVGGDSVLVALVSMWCWLVVSSGASGGVEVTMVVVFHVVSTCKPYSVGLVTFAMSFAVQI